MNRLSHWLRRAILPLSVFLGVLAFHYAWLVVFPEQDPAQSRWAEVASDSSSGATWKRYIQSQSYLLGYSYGLALAFAAFALRRYRESRASGEKNLAMGGVTFTGLLAVFGCYLLGCCGSPMLAVYLGLFGAAFLPFAKPLVAGLTTFSVIVGHWWMHRRSRKKCSEPDCACE